MQGYMVTTPCVKLALSARRVISPWVLRHFIDRVHKRRLPRRPAKPGCVLEC
jgi:hypothetical protein